MGASSEPRYGGLGMALLHALAESGHAIFGVEQSREAARAVGIAAPYLNLLVHRLARDGWIVRIKRGTYALVTGPAGHLAPHPFSVGMALVHPSAVSGWAALNHHGLTEQIPRIITLTTPRRVVTPAMRGAVRSAPSTWTVGSQTYEIAVVVPGHFFGDEETWIGDARVRIFDRERALLDTFASPRRFGGITEGLGILDEHLHEIDVPRLVAYARRYGMASVARRVGFALEQAGAEASSLEPLREMPMQGYRPLDPTWPLQGPRISRWGLRNNLAREVHRSR